MRYQFASGVVSFGYRKWSVATADAVPGGIGTGISVIPVGYWSAPPVASYATTVGEISGGNFVLGVGSRLLRLPAFRQAVSLTNDLRPSPRCASGS